MPIQAQKPTNTPQKRRLDSKPTKTLKRRKFPRDEVHPLVQLQSHFDVFYLGVVHEGEKCIESIFTKDFAKFCEFEQRFYMQQQPGWSLFTGVLDDARAMNTGT